MADINTLLKRILSAVYGKDVRQSIHDAIHKCYEDGRAGTIDLTARERLNDLFPTVKPVAYSWEHLDQIVTARVSSMVGAVANITVACEFNDIAGDIFATIHKGNNPETGLFVTAIHPDGFRLHRRGQLVGDPGVLQWDDWEWENPPMKLGVEYRTTERYSNRPVYIKSISALMPTIGSYSTTPIASFDANTKQLIGIDIRGTLWGLFDGELDTKLFPIIAKDGSISATAYTEVGDSDEGVPFLNLIVHNISCEGEQYLEFLDAHFVIKYTRS